MLRDRSNLMGSRKLLLVGDGPVTLYVMSSHTVINTMVHLLLTASTDRPSPSSAPYGCHSEVKANRILMLHFWSMITSIGPLHVASPSSVWDLTRHHILPWKQTIVRRAVVQHFWTGPIILPLVVYCYRDFWIFSSFHVKFCIDVTP